MKKIWKNLCTCALAVSCGLSVVGCKDNEEVDLDLDKDGVVSAWETLFTDEIRVDRDDHVYEQSSIEYIKNADQLKDITNKSREQRNIQKTNRSKFVDFKIYMLDADIDLNGETVCIDLGESFLFGNGHVISNFQMGTITHGEITGGDINNTQFTESGYNNQSAKCLFYNGLGVYDIRLFMGMQSLDVASNTKDYFSISPFFNIEVINGIEVKGRYDINVKSTANAEENKLDASFVYSGMAVEKWDFSGSSTDSEETIDTYKTKTEYNHTNISNVFVEGVIYLHEDTKTNLSADIGAIASRLPSEVKIVIKEDNKEEEIKLKSTIYNTQANVDIVADVSVASSNIGGIVGTNNGFVTTSNFSGSINLSNKFNKTTTHEYVGGIVGFNNVFAEIKNSVSNAKINFINTTAKPGNLDFDNGDGDYRIGGIAGYNKGGVLQLCTNDSDIVLNSIYQTNTSILVGGLCGSNDLGILSYSICRGIIDIDNVKNVSVAQVAGKSNQGYFEKIITTTSINIDNSKITENIKELKGMKDVNVPIVLNPRVIVGMVTTFAVPEMDEEIAINSPYFKKILVDGVTEVYTEHGDDTETFIEYNHGLRYSYQVETPETTTVVNPETEEEEQVPVFETKTPAIFKDIYYTNTCKFLFYSNNEEGTKVSKNVNIDYALGINNIGLGLTYRVLVDNLDFKSNHNHNEVNISKNNVSLKDLQFTITDERFRKESYFGSGAYNGELSYFDREFSQIYVHDSKSLGFCENDSQDELLSFIYYLMTNNNGKTAGEEQYVVKLTEDYFKSGMSEENTEMGVNDYNITSQKSYILIENIKNILQCLNAEDLLEIKALDAGMSIPEEGSFDTRYIRFNFGSLTGDKYTMIIDLKNFEDENTVFGDNGSIVYIKFKLG